MALLSWQNSNDGRSSNCHASLIYFAYGLARHRPFLPVSHNRYYYEQSKSGRGHEQAEKQLAWQSCTG